MPYICPCNGLKGTFAKECLKEAAAKGERVTSGEIYRKGTGGKKPTKDCPGQCSVELAALVTAYNKKIIPIRLITPSADAA